MCHLLRKLSKTQSSAIFLLYSWSDKLDGILSESTQQKPLLAANKAEDSFWFTKLAREKFKRILASTTNLSILVVFLVCTHLRFE